jgi:C-terminal processing protease CtpA/Prc
VTAHGDPAREQAHEAAHRGVNGEVRVSVPDLDSCLRAFCGENTDFIDALREMNSAFSAGERETLIDQLMLCLRSFYVHQPMKWAKHSVDPVHALTALRRTCGALGDLEFHTAIAHIFKSLRDIHTAYILPKPYSSSVWFLPFNLGAYRDDGTRRIVVDRTVSSFPEASFCRGAEILTWNDQDIERVVHAMGREESGSNHEAQFALGLRMMTIRWLGGSIPPSSHWVTIGYLDPITPGDDEAKRSYREIRLSWRRLLMQARQDGASQWEIPLQAALLLEKDIKSNKAGSSARRKPRRPLCVDRHGLMLNILSERLFRDDSDPSVQPPTEVRSGDTIEPVETSLPQIFTPQRRVLSTDTGPMKFGYLGIAHFLIDEQSFVPEFMRLLKVLPSDQLVIDLRSNAGGNPLCAELVMQFLADRKITPLPFEFLATPEASVWLNGAECDPDFARWGELVSNSVANGFMFSPSRTLTDPAKANKDGRVYKGSVALLVNAITYSTGDIFAALFKDHQVGPIIGEAEVTGGGGADMIDHTDIVAFAPKGAGFRKLPHGARMHLAIRRFLRVGASAGMPVEEAGVRVDYVHQPTIHDFLYNDRDLMVAALQKIKNW